MSADRNGTGSLGRLRRVDAACAAFEAAWVGNARPSIEDYLNRAEPADRDVLFRELLETEIELLRDRGQRPDAHDYRRRFPRHLAAINELLPLPAKPIDYSAAFVPVSRKPPAVVPGSSLGRYEIVERLGAGGMGVVFRARDTRLGRDVAVKVLARSMAQTLDWKLRFEREAKAVARLSHPNVVVVYDVGEEGGNAYVVMELLEGESLRRRVSREPVPWAEAITIGASVADALAAAHGQGVVHRDVKPDNVYLVRDGRVKLLDFGLARLENEPSLQGTPTANNNLAALLGTVGYIAPEQIRGATGDARSDIFALGCVMHEMLSGRPPFKAESVDDALSAILNREPSCREEYPDDVPDALCRVVRRCLAKQPDERYESADAVGKALRTATMRKSFARRLAAAVFGG